MRPTTRVAARAARLAVAVGVATSLLAVDAASHDRPADAAKPTAAVAMGDSFISGEGAGSYDSVVDIYGRRQGYQDFSAPNSNAYFCHRSTVAQIEVASLSGIDERFNLACSGAIPEDVANASNARPKGRLVASQISQLRAVAATHDIDLVVINLGANSVKFGDVAERCISNFITDAFTGWWEVWINIWRANATRTGACGKSDFPSNADFADAQADVEEASRLILRTLAEIDADGDHRVVFQDYTNPLPEEFHRSFHDEDGRRDSRDKFRALARERYAAGCPIHRGALRHAHNMSESLGDLTANVHDRMLREFPGADLVYLNVQHAFDGARLCERSNSPTGALHSPTRAITSRDGRVAHTLDGDKIKIQRLFENCLDHFQRCQESWHPNAAGHAVLGRCLTAATTSTTPLVDCTRRSDGRIVTVSKSPSADLDVSGRVIQSLDRNGNAVLAVSASYAARLVDAPGLSVRSVSVSARTYDTSGVRLPTRRTMSGSYSYNVRCGSTSTIHLAVTATVTLTDGRTVRGSDSFVQNVGSGCGGGVIPVA